MLLGARGAITGKSITGLKTQQRRPKRSSTHSSRLRRGRPSRGGSPISVTYLKKQGWEALAPTTHPADVLGLQKGAREAQTRGGSRQIPDTSYAAKARLRRLVPFLVGDEVKKALQALVEWTTQHWGDDVELVGEDDLAHEHDPPRLLRPQGR